ncbi:hypothetical protein FCL48_22965 [Desulforhopalus sp. IMCC35007]|nr:hypothetical protein FCL48_22965 [Desulforhopalus sp. IMCC35007]
MMIGHESYAGSYSWKKCKNTVKERTSYKHVLPIYQGRIAGAN